MGFFTKAIGLSMAASGIDSVATGILKFAEKKTERKNFTCRFDGDISKEEFYAIVKLTGRKFEFIDTLRVEETMVFVKAHSKEKKKRFEFSLDFNDSGKLTGKYWINAGHICSDIPSIFAKEISRQIYNYPNCFDDTLDDSFYDQICREEIKEAQRYQSQARCPYCGKINLNEDAKFCLYCGKRFRI